MKFDLITSEKINKCLQECKKVLVLKREYSELFEVFKLTDNNTLPFIHINDTFYIVEIIGELKLIDEYKVQSRLCNINYLDEKKPDSNIGQTEREIILDNAL